VRERPKRLDSLVRDFNFNQRPRKPLVLNPGVANVPGPAPLGQPQLPPVPTGP